MPKIVKPGFIWIPRELTPVYKIYINSVDVTDEVISSEWTKSIIGGESSCKISILDVDGTRADTYLGGEVIELKLDMTDGSTSKWKGTLERPKKKFGASYYLEITGSHFQSSLLDITITEDYDGTLTGDEILKALISSYLTGYTSTNVSTTTVKPKIKWDNKPFWDCFLDLCNLCDFDGYIDESKDINFFLRESRECTEDAIVWDDNLLQIESLGTDTIDVKNKVIVYGQDNEGLPIIYQTEDSTSQASYTTKELVIRDNNIKTYNQAKELGDAELAAQKDTSTSGEVTSLLLVDITPGDMIWIKNPLQKVHGTFRIVKYTHTLPDLRTKVIISKEKSIPQLFKERKKAELSLQTITNPQKMEHSYNFSFDDMNDINVTTSTNVGVIEGSLYVSSGTTGTMISNQRTTDFNISSIYIKVVGDYLTSNNYYISTDGGETFAKVSLETLTTVSSGNRLVIKIELSSTTTRLNSLALLYK